MTQAPRMDYKRTEQEGIDAYREMYEHCKYKKQHWLHQRTWSGEPAHQVWVQSRSGYCSRCGCVHAEKMIGNQVFGVWINPANNEIMDIVVVAVENGRIVDEQSQNIHHAEMDDAPPTNHV